MPKKLICALLVIVFPIWGCAYLQLPEPSPDQSLIRGYVTQCRSTVWIIGQDGENSSSLLAPKGNQKLFIRALSEPDFPDKNFSSDSYLCQDVSEHEVDFVSQGGKTYRLHLTEVGSQKYSVSVREGIDQNAVDTVPVKFSSLQTKVKQACRFFVECNEMYGE